MEHDKVRGEISTILVMGFEAGWNRGKEDLGDKWTDAERFLYREAYVEGRAERDEFDRVQEAKRGAVS